MAQTEGRRFFKLPKNIPGKLANMAGITVVPPQAEQQSMVKMPSSEQAAPDVAASPNIDRNAPTLGFVSTSASPDGSNIAVPPLSIGDKAPEAVNGSIMAPVETPQSLDVAPAEVVSEAQVVPVASVSSDATPAPVESVIVPVEKPAEDIVQAPVPAVPEEPIAPTIPEAPIEPVAEVLQPASEELLEHSVSPTAELTGVEATPPEPKVDEQEPEVHIADSAISEPEVQADAASEQEEEAGEEVKIDPTATKAFLKSKDKFIINDELVRPAYDAAYQVEKQSEVFNKLEDELKGLGIDPRAIDEYIAKRLEELLPA